MLTSFAYSYANGTSDTSLRQSMTEADALANGTTTYSYDGQNRLVGASGPTSSYSYAYDAAGNICSTSGTTCSGAYSYNGANELTGSPAGSFTYDSSGQETSAPALSDLAYNPANQTTSITPSGGSAISLAHAGVGQFQRTAFGSTSFSNGPLGLATTSDGTSFIRDPYGNVIGERTPDGSHWYYLKDGLGSVVAVINGSGSTVADRYAYDPYGNPTTATGSVPNPYRYAGGYYDASTGLTKFGDRYYDASAGRWTQPDPLAGSIVTPSTLVPYIYAGDDPVNFVDVNGTSVGSFLAGTFFTLGGANISAAGSELVGLNAEAVIAGGKPFLVGAAALALPILIGIGAAIIGGGIACAILC